MAGSGAARAAAPRWYFETWAILVAGLLVLPAGIYLLVRKPGVRLGARLLFLGAVFAVLFSGAIIELAGGVLSRGVAMYTARTAHLKAWFMHRGGHDVEALRLAQEAFRANPEDAELAVDAARLAAAAGQRTLALSLLQAVAGKVGGRDGEESLLELVELYLDDPATWDRGEALLRESLATRELKPDDPHGLCLLGRVEAARGDVASARYHVRQVVLQFRREYYDRVYRVLAGIERRAGNGRGEVSFLCESLRARHDHGPTVAALSAAVARLGLDPYPYRAFVRALAMYERLEARDEAARLLERILKRAPGFLHADGCHYALATHQYYFKKDHEAALAHYRAIIDRHPASESFLRSHYQTGQALERLGRDEEAARLYVRLVKTADPDAALSRMARQQLVRMRRLGRLGGTLARIRPEEAT
jgi:tetratricopeptide (TPR) repeat protein